MGDGEWAAARLVLSGGGLTLYPIELWLLRVRSTLRVAAAEDELLMYHNHYHVHVHDYD